MTKLNTTWDAQGYGSTITLVQYKSYVPIVYTALALTQDTTESTALTAVTAFDFENDKVGTQFQVAILLEKKLRVDISRDPWIAVAKIEDFKTAYTIV
jgi:hypothetical protein